MSTANDVPRSSGSSASLPILKKYWYVTLGVVIVLVATALIFLLAFPYAWWKVPDQFDESMFQDASVFEGQPVTVVYREKVAALALQNVDAENPSNFTGFGKILDDARGKIVVWENFSLGDSREIQAKINARQQRLKTAIEGLRGGDYYANYAEIQSLSRQFQNLSQFANYLANREFRFSEDYNLYAFKASSRDQYRFGPEEGTIRPLTDLKLLADQSLDDTVRARMEKTADQQKEQLEKKRDEARAQYDHEVLGPQRAQARMAFWIMWYRMLVLFVGVALATGLLALFLSKIHRTGIKPKSTENLYFATNKSQKIFQWVAYIIVFLTLLLIWGHFLISVLLTALGSALLDVLMPEFFGGTILDYPVVFMIPLFFAFMAVVEAWLFLLASEFVWFLSNCYHVIHLRTYGEDAARE